MKTIEIYEKTKTKELQALLTKYEIYLEEGNIHLERYSNDDNQKLLEEMKNYEIDINLIRMELTKRIWKEIEV